jgi:hypothetical protein
MKGSPWFHRTTIAKRGKACEGSLGVSGLMVGVVRNVTLSLLVGVNSWLERILLAKACGRSVEAPCTERLRIRIPRKFISQLFPQLIPPLFHPSQPDLKP